MTYSFFYGLGTGIILSSMLGTVFFFLVQNSILYGIKHAVYIACGVILSDILLISLCYINASFIPNGGTTEFIVRIVGAVFLLILGISSIVKKRHVKQIKIIKQNPIKLATKGFILNIANPSNFFSWLSIAAMLKNALHYTPGERITFFAGALSSIFGMEMVISFGARYLKRWMSVKVLHIIDIVLGIVFIVFSIVLLFPVLGISR